VVTGYNYDLLMDKYIRAHQGSARIVSFSNPGQLYQAVNDGSIKIFLEDRKVLSYQKKVKTITVAVKETACRPPGKIYFAFSPKHLQRSREFIDILDKGQKEMVRSGRMTEIHKRYRREFSR